MQAEEPTTVASVYVHAPFCAQRCPYCDAAITVDPEPDGMGWFDALAAELAIRTAGAVRLAERLRTLYVGGGTPSLLGAGAMEGVAALLGRERLADPELEWTAEANPEDLTPELAAGWQDAGVNRLSLGIQTFHEPSLRWLGRRHDPADADRAMEAARSAGIENVSADLIFGLPEHLGRAWGRDLERTIALRPSHVSLYGLTVEAGTPLARAVRSGEEPSVPEDHQAAEYLQAVETLRAAGYEHYEVTSFAREGRRSRHNAVYWEGDAYLGLGNGAHSFVPPVRSWNLAGWPEYRERCRRGRSPEAARERLDADARHLERIWLALRTRRGWPRTLGERDSVEGLFEEWIGRGLAREEAGRVRLTPRGWLLLDELAVTLDRVLTG